VSQEEAREIAYHYIRIKLANEARPVAFEQAALPGYAEPIWKVTLAGRKEGEPRGVLLIGVQTGATYAWREHAVETALEPSLTA
jgi:hypothetical protein